MSLGLPPPLSDWKSEPVSPLVCEEAQPLRQDDATLYGTAGGVGYDDDDDDACGTKFEIASRLLDDLEHLDNLDDFIKEDVEHWIKDEPFSNWLEDRLLPAGAIVFDDLAFARYEAPPLAPDTPSLLQEFETVLGAVEMARGTLTPPQSPPYETPILAQLQPLAVPPQSIERELAIVDEILRARAQDLAAYPSSPASSSSSNFGDLSSSDDPEWIPETVESPTRAEKRSKPYSRAPPEEKRIRKKEQNKNAATRYRMKKKAEIEVVLEEERILMGKKEDLGERVADLQREIKYLKGLMRDMFKAKGLIN